MRFKVILELWKLLLHCLQELKSLAKRSRQAQDSSKPQRSGDSDSDLDSSEGSDDEVKTRKKNSQYVILYVFSIKTLNDINFEIQCTWLLMDLTPDKLHV